MKMKHQDPNHGGLSHGTTICAPDKKGVIDVPDEAVEAAMAHGFTIHAEPEAKEETPARLEKPAAATTLKK